MKSALVARLMAVAVTVLLGTGLLTGIIEARADVQPGASTGRSVLRVGIPSDPGNLNPFVGSETACYEVWCLNYDQLVGSDPKTMRPSPEGGLAKSWEFSQDGRTCTFHLRDGVKWQDGWPLTAADVAFTYNYIIKNKMSAFTMATSGIKKAVVVDALTVKLVCRAPKADLLYIWIPILPEHIWAKVPPKKAAGDYVNATPIIGSGAYQCVGYKRGNYVRMEVNRDYWRGAPRVDEIVFETYQNVDTMTADLKAGNLDAAQSIPQAQFEAVNSTPGLKAIAYNYRNWNYLCFNCYAGAASKGAEVLRDARFRRALNWAIDRGKLAEIAWCGFAEPGTTILPPGNWVDPDYHWEPPAEVAYRYDPDEAKRLLDAAGYADTDGDGIREYRGVPIVLRLMAGTDSIQEQGEAKLIVSQLRDVGIGTRYEVVDPGLISDRVYNSDGDVFAPDFDLCVWAWDGYFDPGQTLSCFTTAQIGGWNEESWSDPEYDLLCAKQRVTVDPGKRKQIIWRMQQIMYQQSPEIVLTYPKYLQACNTAKWTGWTRVPAGTGPAFFIGVADSYLNLRPLVFSVNERGGAAWIWILVAAVGAAALVAWLAHRQRRRKPLEE